MKCLIPAAIALCLTPLMATAQDAESPITFSGITKVESLSAKHHPSTFIYSQFDLAYRLPLADGFKLGADVGMDVVRRGSDNGRAVFAAAVLDSPYGKLSVGMPRLVMPQVFDTPAIGGSEVAQLVADIFTGDVLTDANMFKNAPVLRGVRYDGTFGPVTVNVALHEYGKINNPLRQIAVTYDGGDWSVSLGSQGIDAGQFKEHSTKLALRGKHGKFSGGIVATRQFVGSGRDNTVEVFGGYDVTDRLRVEAQVFDVVVNSDATLGVGLDASYTLPSGFFVQAGVAHTNAKAGNPLRGTLINVGFGIKF